MDKKITADFKQSFPPKWIMFACGHGNNTTLSVLKQIQTYHANLTQMTVIPRTSPETSNSSELYRNDPRVRVFNKQSTESISTIPIQEIRQTNKIFINHIETQVRLNYVKHQQTNSNIIPRQVTCKTQTSKITTLYEDLKRQFSRILQNPTSNETSQKTQCSQCSQVQNANQLTE
jgi:galactitol-specific phosphotransferase system IIB component